MCIQIDAICRSTSTRGIHKHTLVVYRTHFVSEEKVDKTVFMYFVRNWVDKDASCYLRNQRRTHPFDVIDFKGELVQYLYP